MNKLNHYDLRGMLPGSLLLWILIVFVPAAANGGPAAIKMEYPRLAGLQMGKSRFETGVADTTYQQQMSKLDIVVLGGAGKDMNDYAAAIKKRNPRIIILKYVNIAEVHYRSQMPYVTRQIEKLDSEIGPNRTNASDWWLRDANGEQIEIWPGTYRTNLSEWVKPDSSGMRWPEWRARHDHNHWLSDPVWDGIHSDAVNFRPKFRNQGLIGDYSGGNVTSAAEIHAAYRRAHRAHWQVFRKLRPDALIVGNLNWYLYQDTTGKWDLEEYDQQIEGGTLEAIMDPARSVESTKGWNKLMDYYRWTFSYLKGPRIVLFNVAGNPSDYKFVRYSFATCLMNDGWYDFSPSDKYRYGTVEWFDEFDRNGMDTTGWMGRAISEPPGEPWKSGVYRRDFQNAVVLVNPRGNGPRTVSLEDGLRRLQGDQAPAVNSGAVARSVTLDDADGIVLVKQTYLDGTPPPRPPGLSVEP